MDIGEPHIYGYFAMNIGEYTNKLVDNRIKHEGWRLGMISQF